MPKNSVQAVRARSQLLLMAAPAHRGGLAGLTMAPPQQVNPAGQSHGQLPLTHGGQSSVGASSHRDPATCSGHAQHHLPPCGFLDSTCLCMRTRGRMMYTQRIFQEGFLGAIFILFYFSLLEGGGMKGRRPSKTESFRLRPTAWESPCTLCMEAQEEEEVEGTLRKERGLGSLF